MTGSHDPQQNYLLAALSAAERERVYPHLQLVTMPLGKVLYESGDVLRLRFTFSEADSHHFSAVVHVLADERIGRGNL